MNKILILMIVILMMGCESVESTHTTSSSPEVTKDTVYQEKGLIKDFLNDNPELVDVNITAFSRWNVQFKSQEEKEIIKKYILNTSYTTDDTVEPGSGGYGIEFVFNDGREVIVDSSDIELNINVDGEEVTNTATRVESAILSKLFPEVIIDKEVQINDRIINITLVSYENDDYLITSDGLSMIFEHEITKEELDLINEGAIKDAHVMDGEDKSVSNSPIYLEFKMDNVTTIYSLYYKVID